MDIKSFRLEIFTGRAGLDGGKTKGQRVRKMVSNNLIDYYSLVYSYLTTRSINKGCRKGYPFERVFILLNSLVVKQHTCRALWNLRS